ncbi:hypothetical protein EDD16DRAFT_776150 [Pisolithus croceorrhizus]|nr:hypothetical protein EDD16DRAFT_776150 [Pisolithus croceorrhizus]
MVRRHRVTSLSVPEGIPSASGGAAMERKMFIMTVTSIILLSWPYRPRYIHTESKLIDCRYISRLLYILEFMRYTCISRIPRTFSLSWTAFLSPSCWNHLRTYSKILTTYSKSPTNLRTMYLGMTLADCLDTKYHCLHLTTERGRPSDDDLS